MRLTLLLLVNILLPASTLGHQWPYKRYHAQRTKDGKFHADTSRPEFEEDPHNAFVHWLHHVSNTQDSAAVRSMFINNTIPKHVTKFDELYEYLDVPTAQPDVGDNRSYLLPPMILHLPSSEAAQLFSHLNYPLDPRCTVDRSRWWYRTYDGSCNWLKSNEISEGQIGTAKVRDYNQYTYADGISKPREGPNPRAVSNAFFTRNKTIYYEHTPLLLGLIEFIIHDITYSKDSDTDCTEAGPECIEVRMPADEEYFDHNTIFRVKRTEAVPGTGTSVQNPRENVNMATTWLDISSLYGSTPEVARALRSFTGGKLLTQELKTRGQSTYASYLPFNSMNVPMRTRPDVDPKTLFAGGDPRTNEDWLTLGVHTLMLREHNRLCDILAKQHPEYDDEQLYQTIRLVMSAKYALVANSYQMAYWTSEMPWPRDDGFPLYRQMYGEGVLDINPMNTYPWPLVTKSGKPMVVSAEMAIVYRFHEFIIPEFPIKDTANQTLWNQKVFDTGFNASGFIDAGLENVLRGTVGTHIPNFKSGVDEAFRSAGKYRGEPFDVVTWSIVHEREQGLPTFNQYFRAYNRQDPAVSVPIRDTFEKFSSNPDTVAKLKKLYNAPDDVDLVVGVQLDEEVFPGTTIPKSALIISLFSLFGMGNSDRFSVGFAVTRCFLVDTPSSCKPTNALEELLWVPKPLPDFPNARWLDPFWLTELDFQAHGTNLLWRLITENSGIHCVQQRPLFPADPLTNPVLCIQAKTSFGSTVQTIALSAAEGILALYRQHPMRYNTILLGLVAVIAWYWYTHRSRINTPPVFSGWPVIGKALAFQKDPKGILLTGFKDYGETSSKVFGLKLASLTHFVISQPADLEFMLADNPYEAKFSLHAFLSAINFPLIVHKDNFESDLHTKLIRSHFGDPETVSQFGNAAMQASEQFLSKEPLLSSGEPEHRYPGLMSYLMKYITAVVGGCIVGPEVFDHPGLLETFANFNDHAIRAMGFSSLLPSFLQFIAGFSINGDFKSAREILLPIIQQRRKRTQEAGGKLSSVTFLDVILDVVDENERAADLVTIVIWAGLTNLQATFTSLIMDIINAPTEARTALTKDLTSLDPASLSIFPQSPRPDPKNPWTYLRAAMFESIRLSGPITGPARICLEDVTLPSSSPSDRQRLPKSQVATLSAYYTHRSPSVYGDDAAKWDPTRFLKSDPEIGSVKFITWGLKGPHMCPGRWFAQECLLVMTRCLLAKYDIVPDSVMSDDEKYIYSAGSVTRKDVGVTVRGRK